MARPPDGASDSSDRRRSLEDDLAIAREAAIDAGKLIQQAFGSPLAVRYKSADQPVTEVDLEADRLLRERLMKGRGEYGWLSEETAERPSPGAERVWVVDPLDGTANFVAGRPEFGVCIGLVERGNPVLGVVYNPVTGDLYHGIKGQGSFRNDQPIRARPFDPNNVSLVVSVGEIARGLLNNLDTGWRVQRLGSTALKMMRVAEGGADIYVSRSPKGIWDLAAGSVIVEAAGASVRSLDGKLLDFGALDSLAGLIVVGPGGEVELPGIVRLFGPSAGIRDNVEPE